MLNRSITYRGLLRVAGVLLLLWALYAAFRIAIEPIGETFADGSSDVRLQIQISFTDTLFSIVYFGGVLFFVAAGILFFGLSSRRSSIAYWSIQGAVWLTGISLWYRTNGIFNPFPTHSFWIMVTLLCSLALLILYKPLVYLLRMLLMATGKGKTSTEVS